MVAKRPVLSQSIMASGLVATGDVLAQNLFSDKPYDIKRTAKFGLIGLCYTGPILANCAWLVNLYIFCILGKSWYR